MKKKTPALWAAHRLHRILTNPKRQTQAELMPHLSTLLEEQQALERCARMHQMAQSRGWTHAAQILMWRLASRVAEVHLASKEMIPRRVAAVPSVADILGEITALHDEFELVEINPKYKCITVTTDEITLKDVCLGAFSICLRFDGLARRKDSSAFAIVAEDENCAASNSSCTHPHVQDETLCAGDAAVPISHALAEGRIGDAFQLVNRVLHTYNPFSAYVSLDVWSGVDCADCGTTTSSDSIYYCDECDQDYCDGCIRTCHRCDKSICLSCSYTNDDDDSLCTRCKALDDKEREEKEREEAHEEENERAVSNDPVHDPAEEVPEPQPQPQMETTHEQSPESSRVAGAELPRGTPDGESRAVTARAAPLAA